MSKRTGTETKGGETKGGETHECRNTRVAKHKGGETQGWRNTRVAKPRVSKPRVAKHTSAETQMVPNFFINYQMPKVFLAVGRTRWIAIAIFPDTSSTKVVSKKWFGNLTY